MECGKEETYLGHFGERALAVEHGVRSWQMDQSVDFGAVVAELALAIHNLNALHFRAFAERMAGFVVTVVNQKACKMRVAEQVHVEHLVAVARKAERGVLNTACCKTLTSHHDRTVPF